MPKTKQLEQEAGFYNVDGDLLFVREDGNVFKLDFDNLPKETDLTIKNNIEGDNMKDKDKIDDQAKDTKDTKDTEDYENDNSIASKEKMISDCEKRGKSHEECVESVGKKTKPIDKGDKSDLVEITSKELDMLNEKAKKFDEIEAENSSLKGDLQDLGERVKKIEAKEKAQKEELRQEKAKQISKDFDIPEDELKDDSMEELEKFEKRLDMAIKRNVENELPLDEEIEETIDMAEELYERYRVKL